MQSCTLDCISGLFGCGIVRHIPDGDQVESFKPDRIGRLFPDAPEYLLRLFLIN